MSAQRVRYGQFCNWNRDGKSVRCQILGQTENHMIVVRIVHSGRAALAPVNALRGVR